MTKLSRTARVAGVLSLFAATATPSVAFARGGFHGGGAHGGGGYHAAPAPAGVLRGAPPVHHHAPAYRGPAPVFRTPPPAMGRAPAPGYHAAPGWGVRAWGGRAPVSVLGVRWGVANPSRVWVGPHWGWNAGASVWVQGGWYAPPYAGWQWAPAHWVWNGVGWVWQEGAWVPAA